MSFPKVFESCPRCGCQETITKEAIKPYQENGKLPKDAFASLVKTAVPLLEPVLANLTIPVIVAHMDVCSACGEYYCTKAEITNQPVTFQMNKRAN
jgi:hypothetical protein